VSRTPGLSRRGSKSGRRHPDSTRFRLESRPRSTERSDLLTRVSSGHIPPFTAPFLPPTQPPSDGSRIRHRTDLHRDARER
jgi:hypothetical protein